MNQKTIQIDPDGYLMVEGLRVSDEDFGREILGNLYTRESLFYTKTAGEEVLVDSFDAPLIVLSIHKGTGTVWNFQMPYNYILPFDLKNFCLDDFDRFCGRFGNGVPFVLSRRAQASLFNMVEDYTDTSITVEGVTIELPPKYKVKDRISDSNFWTDLYKNQDTPWDLNEASPVLKQALLQLKLPRQRVAVLGAGIGHDAVEFARAGHLVTAIDISHLAKEAHIKKYGEIKNLNYVTGDAFKLDASFAQNFDLVFDHTFFCAVEPSRRKEVVKLWKRLLVPRGHLLSIHFVMDREEGPPFGISQWELHELLRKDFELLYWTRTKASIPARLNKELLVYAQSLSSKT